MFWPSGRARSVEVADFDSARAARALRRRHLDRGVSALWRNGSASDSRSDGSGFESLRGHFAFGLGVKPCVKHRDLTRGV